MPTDKKTNQSRIGATKRILVIVVLSGVIFGLGFVAGKHNAEGVADKDGLNIGSFFNRDEEVTFSLIEDVWDLIHAKYVGVNEINDEELIFGAIRGMVEALDDPYTVFFEPKETNTFIDSVQGEFEGVGIEIGIRDEQLTVIAPLDGTPADEAGIRAGDKVIAVDGVSTEGITLEEAVTKIRGPKGSTVVLTILRDEGELDISVVRDTIVVPSVEWELREGNIAYIELSHFSETTAEDFSEIAQDILESPADSVILDLRNNPGGFLDASISVSGWFINKGKVVVTEELGDNTKREHKSAGPGSLSEFPLVVLQNEGSASASEIMAGALRDQRGIDIVGEKSFGKGSVQSFDVLGGNTSLKLTVARWITPSGQHINGTGIDPTIPVERTVEDVEADRDPQLDRAVELLK